jgi:hypothetical protein
VFAKPGNGRVFAKPGNRRAFAQAGEPGRGEAAAFQYRTEFNAVGAFLKHVQGAFNSGTANFQKYHKYGCCKKRI